MADPKAHTTKCLPIDCYMLFGQASSSTGSTSAVLWSVQHLGHFEREVMQFHSVRLTQHKQRQEVIELVVN